MGHEALPSSQNDRENIGKTAWKYITHPLYGPIIATVIVIAGMKEADYLGFIDTKPTPLPKVQVVPTSLFSSSDLFDVPLYLKNDP